MLTQADFESRPTVRALYVFLGDYIDRGSASRETIDRLIEHSGKNKFVFLKGNHELIAIKCLSDRDLFSEWMRLGGAEFRFPMELRRARSRTKRRSLSYRAPFTARCRRPICAFSETFGPHSHSATTFLLMPE